jgi:hypothetical protein
MDDATRSDMQAYTGCIAGALTRDELTHALQAAGLTDISITETHRVHAAAASAIVRATKPGSPAGASTTEAAEQDPAVATASSCCSTSEQATCCETSAKSECCDSDKHALGACGCQ